MIRAEEDERGRSLSEEEEEEALECDIKGSFIMAKTGLSKVNWMGGIFISLSLVSSGLCSVNTSSKRCSNV